MTDDRRVKLTDSFLLNYQPSELKIASEFLTSWLPFLSRDLCHHCTTNLSNRIRSLNSEFARDSKPARVVENVELREEAKNNHGYNFGANSVESSKIGEDTNLLGSRKDAADVSSEFTPEASTRKLVSESLAIETFPRMSWADMAEEDELEGEEEEERESSKRVVNGSDSNGVSKTVEKPKLSREQREYIRFMNVKRKNDYICFERVKGKFVNILAGLELHTGIFSAAEQKRIVDHVYMLLEKGRMGELRDTVEQNKLSKEQVEPMKVLESIYSITEIDASDYGVNSERTYTAPEKWMKGKGRVTIQFGCCYNYAVDKNGNPPGILRNETVDPIPHLFKVIIRRLVRWHVLPPTCIPDSCIVNVYDEGDCIPPHIDSHDFVRPFCTVSFLSECSIFFGSNLKIVGPGEFAGSIAISLPVGSVLVLNGNGADVAKHCVPAVPAKRISITFRRMDESKRPIGYSPEPDLLRIQPLSYDMNETDGFSTPGTESHTKRRSFQRSGNRGGSGFSGREPHTEPGPPWSRRGPGSRRRGSERLGST